MSTNNDPQFSKAVLIRICLLIIALMNVTCSRTVVESIIGANESVSITGIEKYEYDVEIRREGGRIRVIFSGQLDLWNHSDTCMMLKGFSWGRDSEPFLFSVDSLTPVPPRASTAIRYRVETPLNSLGRGAPVPEASDCDSLIRYVRDHVLPHRAVNRLDIYYGRECETKKNLYHYDQWRIPVEMRFDEEHLRAIGCGG